MDKVLHENVTVALGILFWAMVLYMIGYCRKQK